MSSVESQGQNNISLFLQGLFSEDPEYKSPTNVSSKHQSTGRIGPKRKEKVIQSKKLQMRLKKYWTNRYNNEIENKLANLPICEKNELNKHPGLLEREKDRILTSPFSIECIEHSNELVELYTGIPLVKGFFNNLGVFREEAIIYPEKWNIAEICMKDQLLLTLMKLRLNMSDMDLSKRFMCSLETVGNTIQTWIKALHDRLFDKFITRYGQLWNPKKNHIKHPKAIVKKVQIFHDVPKNAHLPHATPNEPFTAIIGINTFGIVIYASDCYRWTEDNAFEKSGLLRVLTEEGDRVVHDGSVKVPEQNAIIVSVIPEDDPYKFKNIMVDVEQRLKEYQILNRIPSNLKNQTNLTWQVCVLLVNQNSFRNIMTSR